jgi:hypothetical protein
MYIQIHVLIHVYTYLKFWYMYLKFWYMYKHISSFDTCIYISQVLIHVYTYLKLWYMYIQIHVLIHVYRYISQVLINVYTYLKFWYMYLKFWYMYLKFWYMEVGRYLKFGYMYVSQVLLRVCISSWTCVCTSRVKKQKNTPIKGWPLLEMEANSGHFYLGNKITFFLLTRILF